MRAEAYAHLPRSCKISDNWRLPHLEQRGYIAAMGAVSFRKLGIAIGLTAGAMVLTAGTGLAFAGWVDHGPSLFMALVESGLSCF